jgi:hypothetical protein
MGARRAALQQTRRTLRGPGLRLPALSSHHLDRAGLQRQPQHRVQLALRHASIATAHEGDPARRGGDRDANTVTTSPLHVPPCPRKDKLLALLLAATREQRLQSCTPTQRDAPLLDARHVVGAQCVLEPLPHEGVPLHLGRLQSAAEKRRPPHAQSTTLVSCGALHLTRKAADTRA